MDFVKSNPLLVIVILLVAVAFLGYKYYQNGTIAPLGQQIMDLNRVALQGMGCTVEGQKVTCQGGMSLPSLGSTFNLNQAAEQSLQTLKRILTQPARGPPPGPPGPPGPGAMMQAPPMGVPMGGHAMPPSSTGPMMGGGGGMGGGGMGGGMGPMGSPAAAMAAPTSPSQTGLGGGGAVAGGTLSGASGFGGSF